MGSTIPTAFPAVSPLSILPWYFFMSYKVSLELKNTPWKHILFAFWGAAAFVILAEKLVDNTEQFHFSVFYAALLLLALYTGCIYLYQKGKWNRDVLLLAVLTLVSTEAAVNMAVTSIPTTSRTAM